MMGDRDYRSIIKNIIENIGEDLELKIDPEKPDIIHLAEVVSCLRRSYYNRIDPIKLERKSFNFLLNVMFRKLEYSSKSGEFPIEELKLKGQADIIVDDVVLIFRSVDKFPENPLSSDLLFLNGCMWIFNKMEGIIIYLTGDGNEYSFYLNKDKNMFEQIVRRVKVLNTLLKEKKVPIIEPSSECSTCQYYQRCFIKKKEGKTFTLKEMLGKK